MEMLTTFIILLHYIITNEYKQVFKLLDSTYLNRSCPICSNELPDNFNDIYCSASSVVKVAIRRLRKARLLLDLNVMRDVKRLRSTVELILNPRCSCPPLDNRKYINMTFLMS